MTDIDTGERRITLLNPRRIWEIPLKLIVSLGILFLVLVKIRNRQWLDLLSQAQAGYVLAGFCFFMLGNFFNTLKWMILVRALGIHLSLGKAFNLYMVGSFFNNFLPTGAGDLKRIIDLTRHSNRSVDAFVSVIVERWLGFLSLLLMCLATLGLDYPVIRTTPLPATLLVILAVSLLICLLMIGSSHFAGVFSRFKRFQGPLKQFQDSYEAFRKKKIAFLYSLLLSLPQPILGTIYYYFVALSMGLDLELPRLLFPISLTTIVAQMPISINGVGVQEAGLILTLAPYGIPASWALSISILSYTGRIASGLVGGCFYLANLLLGRERATSA